jgi:CRP/FNR family transcriptional regulator, anaerobic regulatory protein
MDKLWYLSRFNIFETLPYEDLVEIDRMAPTTHFNKLPKGTMVQTPDFHREGLCGVIRTGRKTIMIDHNKAMKYLESF